MNWFSLMPVLAAAPVELYRLLILFALMLGGAIVKKIQDARDQAERAKAAAKSQTGRPPAVPPRRENEPRAAEAVWTPAGTDQASAPRRENPFRNEIEAFLEEVGRRRSPSDGSQPGDRARVDQMRSDATRGAASASLPQARPTQARPTQSRPLGRQPQAPSVPVSQRTVGPPGRMKSDSAKAVPPSGPQSPPQRPGSEMASRKAPVSDDLGAQVRAHLSQYLESSRMSQRAQAELGSAVERAVRAHLGETATRGTGDQEPVQADARPGTPFANLLRDPTGVRTAILVNEILERPRCLRRKT